MCTEWETGLGGRLQTGPSGRLCTMTGMCQSDAKATDTAGLPSGRSAFEPQSLKAGKKNLAASGTEILAAKLHNVRVQSSAETSPGVNG